MSCLDPVESPRHSHSFGHRSQAFLCRSSVDKRLTVGILCYDVVDEGETDALIPALPGEKTPAWSNRRRDPESEGHVLRRVWNQDVVMRGCQCTSRS